MYFIDADTSFHINELQTLLKDALNTFRPLFVEGISEYDLISILRNPPYRLFDKEALRDSLLLFQTHFVLFHCLYHLRKEWRAQKVGELDIGLTHIILRPMLESSGKIQAEDKLADYYMNLSNLSATNEDDVEALLDSFWQQMAGIKLSANISESELKRACVVMEIKLLEDTNLSELKQQYHKLQHLNHPDKGGSIEKSQSVLQAYTQLRRYITIYG